MMRDGQVVLSRRLQMLADLVTKGYRTADVGCDHGFLSIYLIQQGISSRVLAMDVRKGPLTAAQEHIAACGLEAYIEPRLSDGLAALCPGEAETLICAGMGGSLMEKILRDGLEKARGLKELILQPQSEIGAFRRFLRGEGFRILAEDAVWEDGKYYFAMKAVYIGAGGPENPQETTGSGETAQGRDAMPPGEGEEAARGLADEYGELLLKERHPVLRQYLNFRKGVLEQLEERLCADEGRGAEDIRAEAAGRTEAAGGTEPTAGTKPTGETEPAEGTKPTGETEPAEGTKPTGGTEAATRKKERLAQVRRELGGVNEALRYWEDPLGTMGVKRHFAPDITGRR